MKRVMLNDRLFDRVKTKEMILLDGPSREFPERRTQWESRLQRAFEAGASFAPE
jgi:NAD(P)H dehydrogenase (quinone)